MKLFNPFLCLLAALPVISCVTTSTYTVEEKKMRVESEPVFIVKSDGEKMDGKKISKPFSVDATWIKLDGQKYTIDELQAFQDQHAYHTKFRNLWVKQLKRGKISLYYYEVTTRMATMGPPSSGSQYQTDQHFVFQKGDGPLEELSTEGVSKLLQDNPEAQARFDAQFKPGRVFLPKQMKNHPKVLFDAIDIYNRG